MTDPTIFSLPTVARRQAADTRAVTLHLTDTTITLPAVHHLVRIDTVNATLHRPDGAAEWQLTTIVLTGAYLIGDDEFDYDRQYGGTINRVAAAPEWALRLAMNHADGIPPAGPTECRTCGADWGHGEDLSLDQWEAHREDAYQTSREHGATRDGADDWSRRETVDGYGTRPEGPSRPFGPWLDPGFVATHLDHLMKGHRP